MRFLSALWAAGLLVTGAPAAFSEEPSAYASAVAYYHDRKLDLALRSAQEAVRQNPDHVDAHFLLGELYYLRQEMSKAKDTWERAAKLAPERKDIQERLERVRRELQAEKGLARNDTYPFVVRFAAEDSPVDIGQLKQILRDAHRRVGQQMSYFPGHSITVLLYPEREFQAVKGVSHQVGGLYDGKIRLPLRSGQAGSVELQRVLWHEYTHAIIHDLSKGKCPLWLNEGIATLQESRILEPDLSKARAAMRAKQLPSWVSLWEQTYDPLSLELNYEVSFLIADYLVKRWSWRDLVGLLEKMGQGFPVRDALRAQYHGDPALIEQEWVSWLRRRF